MKKFRMILSVVLMLALCMSATGMVFATPREYTAPLPGLTEIRPGDILDLPSNTVWASLKAVWGVRVTFKDKDGDTVLVVPVTDDTVTVDIPEANGSNFVGWERTDDSDGTLTISDDGETITISGKGPFELTAMYFYGGTYEPYEPKPITPEPEEPEVPEVPEEPEVPAEEPEEPEEIPDAEPPLSDVPEEPVEEPAEPVEGSEELEDLEDPEIPLADVPETGDNAVMYGMLMIAVCSGLGALMIRRKDDK